MEDIQRMDLEQGRFYSKNGIMLPSVTTVLKLLPKEYLIDWSVKLSVNWLLKQPKLTWQVKSDAAQYHKIYLKKVAAIGTNNHNAMEKYFTGQTVKETNFIKRLKGWEEQYQFEVEATEKFVHSEKYRSAGTFDLMGKCGKILFIIDLKTSKAIYVSHKIQACAYRLLNGAMNYRPAILLIPRDTRVSPEFYILNNQEILEYSKLYIELVNLFHRLLELNKLNLM